MELKIAGFVPGAEVAQHRSARDRVCCSAATRRDTTGTGMTMVTRDSRAEVEAIVKQSGERPRQSNEDFIDRLGIRSTKIPRGKVHDDRGVVPLRRRRHLGTISIDSWSECFTLPEGTYPEGHVLIGRLLATVCMVVLVALVTGCSAEPAGSTLRWEEAKASAQELVLAP